MKSIVPSEVGRAAATAVLGLAAVSSGALCAERALREFALDAALRGGACGGLVESTFALGQCWHCYGLAAAALFVAGAVLMGQTRFALIKP